MAGKGGCEFVVAVTGHTRIGDEAKIRALVDRALREIKSAAEQALAAGSRAEGATSAKSVNTRIDAPELRMVLSSCLAAGADQLVAEAALAAGYSLRAVLPGNPGEYRKMIRFADDSQREARSRNAYDVLLKSAGTDVTNLAMPLPEGPADEPVRQRAYDAATQWMLDRSDLLIALVDVLHRKDLGMTGDAVRFALRRRMPIVWIDPSDPRELKWLGHRTEQQFVAIASVPVEQRVVAGVESVSEMLAQSVASAVEAKCGSDRLPGDQAR